MTGRALDIGVVTAMQTDVYEYRERGGLQRRHRSMLHGVKRRIMAVANTDHTAQQLGAMT